MIAPINTKVTTQTVSYNNPLQYGDTVTIAKVNNIDIPVTLPAVPASVQSATQDGNGNNIADTYVTSLGTNGNYVTWTKASATNNITVPYSVKAQQDREVHLADVKKRADEYAAQKATTTVAPKSGFGATIPAGQFNF